MLNLNKYIPNYSAQLSVISLSVSFWCAHRHWSSSISSQPTSPPPPPSQSTPSMNRKRKLVRLFFHRSGVVVVIIAPLSLLGVSNRERSRTFFHQTRTIDVIFLLQTQVQLSYLRSRRHYINRMGGAAVVGRWLPRARANQKQKT